MKRLFIAILMTLVFANHAKAEPIFKHGATSQLIELFISDSASTVGGGLAGLAYNDTNLTAKYYCSGASSTAISLATMTIGTWASGGFIEIDATDMPGWYQFGIPNAALVSGCGEDVNIHIFEKTTTDLNIVPLPFAISLVANLESDTVTTLGTAGDGLTAINLPNQTMDIAGDITGSLSGSVGSVTGAVGSVTGSVGSVVGHTPQSADHTTGIAENQTDLNTIITNIAALNNITVAEIRDMVIEGEFDLGEMICIIASYVSKLTTSGSTATFRGLEDTEDRMTFTFAAGGNRSAVTYDLTGCS